MEELTKPIRLDPEYMDYAYRKAIIQHLIFYLESTFLGKVGDTVKDEIVCEDVIYTERMVPPKPIEDLIYDLRKSSAAIQRELERFNFRKDINSNGQTIQPKHIEEQEIEETPKEKRKGRPKANGGEQNPTNIHSNTSNK